MSRRGNARHAAKRDDNEPAIVDALREAGCLVERVNGVGVPDLIVWSPRRRCVVFLEVKGAKSRRRLSDAQKAFRDTWGNAGALVFVVSTPAEALLLCQ